MQKLQNYILQEFINKCIVILEKENDNRKFHRKIELNIPFILSSLYQSFAMNQGKYKEFISDLETYSDYRINIDDSENDYDGIIDMNIILYNRKADLPNYKYKICFSEDDREYDDYGYDTTFCEFLLKKIIYVVEDSWHGDENDYLAFEDEFYHNETRTEKSEKEKMIKELKSKIEEDRKLLEELMKS